MQKLTFYKKSCFNYLFYNELLSGKIKYIVALPIVKCEFYIFAAYKKSEN